MDDLDSSPSANSALDACHELEYLLLGDLRELLDDPETPDTRRSLLIILDHLLVNLPRQLELKREGGFMAEILARFPLWQVEIDALQGEDAACNSALVRLHDCVSRELPLTLIAGEVRGSLDRWMEFLDAIRVHETQLLQTAFTLDLGGEA